MTVNVLFVTLYTIKSGEPFYPLVLAYILAQHQDKTERSTRQRDEQPELV